MKRLISIFIALIVLAACLPKPTPPAPRFASGQVIVSLEDGASRGDLEEALESFEGTKIMRPLMDEAGIWLLSVPTGTEQQLVTDLPKSPVIASAELDTIMTITPAGDAQ